MPIRRRPARKARSEINQPRDKNTIHHFGRISPEMAHAYINSILNTKPAFRWSGWENDIRFFLKFV